ncbi:MAG: hypothetical protein WB798_16925, partial [Nocardioidaceae bacterium]
VTPVPAAGDGEVAVDDAASEVAADEALSPLSLPPQAASSGSATPPTVAVRSMVRRVTSAGGDDGSVLGMNAPRSVDG